MNEKNILIAGVGGQGVILASEILSEVGIKAGYDVKKSEIHGMSQRGGSVTSDVRWNKEKVYSPTISKKSADFILGFEKLETLRSIDMIKPDGVIISSDYHLDPMTVSAGNQIYPEDVEEKIKKIHSRSYFFSNEEVIKKIGNPKAINIFIVGALSYFMNIDKELWFDVIKNKVPPKTVKLNIKAFEEGYNIVKK
jgi:indolepyruvate ferredoxin oxidoreductase beta subunit